MRDWLRELRLSKKMTQQDLGQRVGVSDVSVTYWESGQRRPSYDLMVSLADVLGKEVMDHFAAESRDKTGEVA